MSQGIKELLEKRRDRCIAKVLAAKDDIEYGMKSGNLGHQDIQYLRKVILDEFNDFCNMAMDIIDSIDDESVVLNQDYLERIDKIYEAVGRGGIVTKWH
jgi:hypothetical protein